jgi:hypothetical protein
MPIEFVHLCWKEFKRRHIDKPTKEGKRTGGSTSGTASRSDLSPEALVRWTRATTTSLTRAGMPGAEGPREGLDVNARAKPSPRDAKIESLRLPPHSVEAEQAVLGGLMLRNDRVGPHRRPDHRADVLPRRPSHHLARDHAD